VGRLAKLLSFVRTTKNEAQVSEAKADPGGGAIVTAEHFSAPGDDSHPLPGDYVTLNSDSGTGRETAVGYVDPINAPKALPGDKRIYARDEDGAVVVEIWLKNTGEATVLNANGSIVLRPDGGSIMTTPASTFNAAADGAITATNSEGSFTLAADGAITAANLKGSYSLAAAGDFSVNGVIIGVNGNITTGGTITALDVTASSTSVTLSTHLTEAFDVPPTPGT